ncbi:unnamed protein product, partial [Rotaria magnacalcarata]
FDGTTDAVGDDETGVELVLCLFCLRDIVIQLTSSSCSNGMEIEDIGSIFVLIESNFLEGATSTDMVIGLAVKDSSS